MKVLVTGATGFLGGWLVRRLLDEGCDVRITARPSSPLEDLQGLPLDIQPGDVTNAASMVEACRGVDSVFHLAGLIAYSRSQRQAMEKVNVQGTENVLNAATAQGVRRLVHASSVVAVGASFDGQGPLNEDSPFELTRLNLGYFETKRRAEALVMSAAKAKKIDAVCINPSTVYGPGDAKKGSRGVQSKVAKAKFPFFTSGGVNVVAVEDVVSGVISAWKKGRTGERYILCGENILIRDLFRMIADAAGVRPPQVMLPNPVVHALGKAGDLLEALGKKAPINSETAWTSILYHWFDASKAQQELGFTARPAAHAISQSVQWIKDHRC